MSHYFTIKILSILFFVCAFAIFLYQKPYEVEAGCSCSVRSSSCDCPSGTLYITYACTGTYVVCQKYDWVKESVLTGWEYKCVQTGLSLCGFYTATGGSCTCCTPSCNGSCDVPVCPLGSQETPNGCSVSSVQSCSYGDGCGGGCGGGSRTCYYSETNLSFIQSNGSTSGPSSVSMIVDGVTYALSTDSNNPTHIKLPANGSSNVQITTPAFTAPTTSRGANYYYQVNNYGNNDEWKTWTTCSGTDGEDFCTTMPNSNNTQSFTPTSKTVNQVLKENATGKISAMYATTDKCNNTYKYSLPTEGYYVVDIIPDTVDEDGNPISDVNPEDIFPDITTDQTARGCSSTTYTGQDINNALHVVTNTKDNNSNDEIQAYVLWFTKDNTIPTFGTITSNYTGSNNQDLGVMIRKNGSDWSNPNIYTTNNDLTWSQLPSEYISVNGSNIARIYDVSVTEGTNLTFDYKIEFLVSNENLSGMYNVYGGGLDTHMINGNTIDQSYLTSLTDWGIDLVNPTVNDITQEVKDATNLYLAWSVSDDTSSIDKTVMNAYRVGGLNNDSITLYTPPSYSNSKGTISLTSGVPDTDQIGMYTDTNAWTFISNLGETDMIDIGNNESGNIIVYTTPYDLACNTNATSENIDLNPWFASRGGSVYSVGNISSAVKDVSSVEDLDGVFNPKTAMTKERIDLGTELLATKGVNISSLIHSTSGAVRGLNIDDTNNQDGDWFIQLYRKFEKQRDTLTFFTKGTTDNETTDSCTDTNCYMYSTEDISIPQNYICNVPTLFLSEKDIYIEPNIGSGSGLSGCIFLAKNNIYVGAGKYVSDTRIKYDHIEGFLIADNQIVFTFADQSHVLRDGVEVYGGVVAFGSNVSGGNAISIERNMRLFNQTNPMLVVTYNDIYSNLSYIFFGTSAQLYKQEVGFKTGD